MKSFNSELFGHIQFLYGEDKAQEITDRVNEYLNNFAEQNPLLSQPSAGDQISQTDSILITYGDMVQKEGEVPLQTLAGFLKKYLKGHISTIHILPFYPYSSDDGFSVIDYRKVNPSFGDWPDVVEIGTDFRMMYDAVVNHISAKSDMFQGFLRGEDKYKDFFTVVDPGVDLTRVFRPRATPVLTPYDTPDGEKLVWTTFSADQIDLNYRNPEVLMEVIDILLFYAVNGAEFIRFDAVTYVWKEVGTPSINLPHTHRFVQLMRTILNKVAPSVAIITETNVPHKDNIAYFGDGTNEAQMVYNFALPLLTLNSFLQKDVTVLSEWAKTLDLPSETAAFFNFLACHDGIGMLPVKDILSVNEIDQLAERAKKQGGNVSYKSNEDGSQSPYEMNINYLDALMDPEKPEESASDTASRFLASQAVMLALRGVPGIYFHSLFGSRNWIEGLKQTGRNRTINREKLQLEALEADLADPASLRSLIFSGFCQMLKARQDDEAFHPYGEQAVLDLHPAIFALVRTAQKESTSTLCLQNVSEKEVKLEIGTSIIKNDGRFREIISGNLLENSESNEIMIPPFGVLWLKPI